MDSTNIRAKIKWCYPRTNKLEYFLSAIFDEHNNTFEKGWSPCSEPITSANISTHPTLKLISQITPSSNMIYLKILYFFHQEVLILALFPNTVIITTCPLSLSQK